MAQLSDPSTWLDTYGDTLYRHALFRLQDAMLAEEIVQETLLAALQARHNFAGKSSEKTWLIGILKHKVIDHIRKAVRELPLDEAQYEFDSMCDEMFDGKGHWKIDVEQWSNPDRSLEQQQFWRAMEDCISRLPDRLAILFVLREVDGMDSESICKELQISSTNNLWVMLSRTRMRLRKCLGRQWFGQERG